MKKKYLLGLGLVGLLSLTACTFGTEGSTTTEVAPSESTPVHQHELVHHDAKAATCTEAGNEAYDTCKSCDYTTLKAIPAKGHTEVVDAAVAATCTEAGKTEGKHCSVCNTVITAQTEVTAAGHTEVVDAAVAATCTVAGKTEGKHCSVCNTVITAQAEVAAGHTEVVDAAVAATCTVAGKTEGKHCSVCNTVITAQTEVPAGHTYVYHEEKEASYDEDGHVAYYSCSACDKVFDAEKAETTMEAVTLILPIFEALGETDPVFLFGKDIEVTYDEERAAVILGKEDAIAAALDDPTTVAVADFMAMVYDLEEEFEYLVNENRYAKILSDAYATEEYYDLDATTKKAYLDMYAFFNEMEVKISETSAYRAKYFLEEYGYDTDEAIDAYVASLNPEADKAYADIQEKMDTALNKYMTGAASGYDALVEYKTAAQQLADLYDYDNFLDYCYPEEYGREYTVEATKDLGEYITKYILPVYDYSLNEFISVRDAYRAVRDEVKANADDPNYEIPQVYKDYSAFLDMADFFYLYYLEYFDGYANWLGDDYLDNFKYYFNSGNYWYSNNPNENVTGYCWSFYDGTPLMFLGPDCQEMSTFIHEFGHYNAAITGADINYDVDETQSQGNEMLFYNYLLTTDIGTETTVETYKNYKMLSLCDAIMTGYTINELEKFVYTNDFTKAELEAKWIEIGAEIGQDYSSQSYINYMYTVLLNYNGYYISYATSAIASLEIGALAATDLDKAKEAYISIYTVDANETSFSKALANAGLYNVFEEEAFQLIANGIHGHSSVDDLIAIPASAPTCAKDGNIAFYGCKGCYHYYDADLNELTMDDIVIPATGEHTPDEESHVAAVAATNCENGNIEYYLCSECEGYCDVEGNEIENVIVYALHPNKVEHAAVPHTCTKDGNIYYFVCPDCEKTYNEEYEVIEDEDTVDPADFHLASLVLIRASAPTATENGNIACYYCQECDEYLDPETGAELTEEEIVIPATGSASE